MSNKVDNEAIQLLEMKNEKQGPQKLIYLKSIKIETISKNKGTCPETMRESLTYM